MVAERAGREVGQNIHHGRLIDQMSGRTGRSDQFGHKAIVAPASPHPIV